MNEVAPQQIGSGAVLLRTIASLPQEKKERRSGRVTGKVHMERMTLEIHHPEHPSHVLLPVVA